MWKEALFFFLPCFLVCSVRAELPADVRNMLEKLPGKSVRLDVVLARAIQSSDSYRQVLAQYPLVEVPDLSARAAFDPRFTMKYEFTDNRNEVLNAAMPSNTKGAAFGLGLAMQFPTGTGVSAQVETGTSAFQFGANQFSYFQSVLTLGLTQNLWQDGFGQAARDNLRAGEEMRKAALAQFYDSIETWSLSLIGIFYDAWLAKMRLLAMIENTKRTERLEKTMRIKTRRGTSEEPDLLQVQSNVFAAQTLETEAEQALKDKWQALVVNLKLPRSWMQINPLYIPIEIDDPVSKSKSVCQSQSWQSYLPQGLRKMQAEARASQYKKDAAKSMAHPDLELRAGVSANGTDSSSRSPTLEEVQGFRNPAYSAGIYLTVPLYSRAEEAQLRAAIAENARAEATAANAESQLELDWISSCHQLRRMATTVELLTRSLQNQVRRARLDERRFDIGRTQIFTVIQAGQDATQTELNLRQAEIQSRLSAWRVLRLNDGFQEYLKSLESLQALKFD